MDWMLFQMRPTIQVLRSSIRKCEHNLRFVCCWCCCWNSAYRLAAAGLNTPGGTNGEKADFIGNVGDGAGTAIGGIASSPVNIASMAWTTSPRYFCNRVSTSLRRRFGNTLKYKIVHNESVVLFSCCLLFDRNESSIFSSDRILKSWLLRKRNTTKCTYRNKTSIGDLCVVIAPMNWCDAWWYGKKPAFWPPFTCIWRIMFGVSIGVFGGDVESSFFKLKFSGVASSGAESTSKSDSGELGRPFWFGELDIGILNDVFFKRGLLGDDSEPVSWSVSVDIRWRFVPTMKW